MHNMTVSRDLAAPRSNVWAVLADFPNISVWNTGVKSSHSTSESIEGVGAKRHCDLSPTGTLEETVLEWSPEEKMVISIDEAGRIPVKRGVVTFSLGDSGDTTPTTVSYDFEPNGGPFAPLVGKVLTGQLRKGFGGFLDDLETAARAADS